MTSINIINHIICPFISFCHNNVITQSLLFESRRPACVKENKSNQSNLTKHTINSIFPLHMSLVLTLFQYFFLFFL